MSHLLWHSIDLINQYSYEAYVIYMFFNLLETFINTYDEETDTHLGASKLYGEARVIEILSAKPLSEHPV